MNILITGHRGFIGSVLTKKLEANHNIIGLDIRDGSDISTCELPTNIDVVIHLAGNGGVRESLANPGKYWNNNVEATKRILDFYKDQRVLVAGSSSQYEPHLNPYAASKCIIESIPHNNVCFMRFHTVYSSTPRANMFFDKLLNGTLEYTTNHYRDFIHVEDLTDGIELLIKSKFTGPIDIGTGESISIQDIRPDLPVKLITTGERARTQADTTEMSKLGHKIKYHVKQFLTDKGF